MSVNFNISFNKQSGRATLVGGVGVAALVALSVVAVAVGVWKVLVVAWVAFGAMATGAWLGARAETTDPYRLVWGYDLALGLVAGYSAHVLGHRLTHVDVGVDLTTVQIAAHALSAGLIIGFVYGTLPALGLLLGLSIVSHKGPAGYAAARRLARDGRSATVLLFPAAATGVAAIPAATVALPATPWVNAVVFGFAAGIFLHVAMDFLPNCEAGSEVDEVCAIHENSHDLLDELRTHAVASTVIGGASVVVAWALLPV
jgi:ZIP family zinc transporter